MANKILSFRFPKWNLQIMNTIYLGGFFIIQSSFFFITEIYGISKDGNNVSIFDALWVIMELMIWVLFIFLVANSFIKICIFCCIIIYAAINVTTQSNFLSHVTESIIASITLGIVIYLTINKQKSLYDK